MKQMRFTERYDNRGPIGEGYFSIVLKCARKFDGTEFAVKQLRREVSSQPDYLRRFKREIELLQKLKPHPNIIDLVEHEQTSNPTWYVMPLARMNLEKFIRRNNTTLLPEKRLLLFEKI